MAAKACLVLLPGCGWRSDAGRATRRAKRGPTAWLALWRLLGVGIVAAGLSMPAGAAPGDAAVAQPEDPVAAGLLEKALRGTEPAAAVQTGLELAARYQARKDAGCAEAILREMARRYPKTRPAEVCFELGYLLFAKYEWRPEALRWFRRAVAAGEPRMKAAQAQLFASYVYGEMGDQRQAEAEFARLRELFPEDRRRIAQGIMDSIFFRSWTSPDPEGLLFEAQDVRYKYADFRDIAGALDMLSGRLLLSLGRPAEALPLFERVPADLDFPAARKADALRESVLCHLQMGAAEKAQAALAAMAQQGGAASRQGEMAGLAELVARCAPGGAHASLRVVVTDPKDGGPVPGALVRVQAGRLGDMPRYADAQGVAVLDPLLPGNASFLVSVGGRFVTESQGVTLAAGRDATTATVKALRARPEFPKVPLRLLTPEGGPAADADVQVWGIYPPLLHSDAEGTVALPDIWRVRGNEERKVLSSVPGVGVAAVEPRAIREGAVRLLPGGAIEGTVVSGAEGKPVFGAPVCAILLAGIAHTVAGPDGTFRFDTLPPGEYTVAATASRPAPGGKGARTVTLHAGETVKDVRLLLDGR